MYSKKCGSSFYNCIILTEPGLKLEKLSAGRPAGHKLRQHVEYRLGLRHGCALKLNVRKRIGR